MKRMTGKGKLLLAFIILSIIIGTMYYRNIPVESNQATEISDENPKNDLGIPIELIEVTEKTLTERLSYIGTIQSKESVQISSKIPAHITELNIYEGDVVKKGQIIARLDNASIGAKINTINVNIERIQLNLEYLYEEEPKYKVLYDEGGISESAYKKIKHERDMAEIQLKEVYALRNELEVSLNDTIIRSPLSGVVKIVNYAVGDLAVAGKPLVIIDDTSELSVNINITESDLLKIDEATVATLEIFGVEEIIKTHVGRMKSSINPKTRIGEIELTDLDIEDTSKIPLGSSVSVDFIIQEVENGIVIPANSIKELSDKKVVYLVKDNYVEETLVQTGLQIDNDMEIVQGLKPGDKIAVGNINKLYDKARVYIFQGESTK